MIQEKIQAVADLMIKAYPEQLKVTAIVHEDRIMFMGTAFSVEGPYPLAGIVTMDELIRLTERQAAALVLMRSLIED